MKNNTKTKTSTPQNESQDKIACSICGKEFKLKEKYIIAGGCACSWKCFLKEVKRRESEKMATGKCKNNKSKNK